MAQRTPDPPEISVVFERSPALGGRARGAPPVVVASSCRTTREVVAWAVATELGLRCYVARSAREALGALGLDDEGGPLTERFGEPRERPGAVALDAELLLEAATGPTLCRALHELAVATVVLRGGSPRDVMAAERAAALLLPTLAGRARCA